MAEVSNLDREDPFDETVEVEQRSVSLSLITQQGQGHSILSNSMHTLQTAV